MAILVHANVGEDIEPASPGVHDAVLAEIVDLGPETHPKFGLRHQGVFMIQLAETYEFDGEVRRKEVRGYFDLKRGLGSVNHAKGTKLRRWLEGWSGKKWTKEMLLRYAPVEQGGQGKPLDLEPMIGKPLQVVVSHQESGEGKVYANLDAMLPANKNEADRIHLDPAYKYEPYHERDRNSSGGGGGGNGGAVAGGAAGDEGGDDIPDWFND